MHYPLRRIAALIGGLSFACAAATAVAGPMVSESLTPPTTAFTPSSNLLPEQFLIAQPVVPLAASIVPVSGAFADGYQPPYNGPVSPDVMAQIQLSMALGTAFSDIQYGLGGTDWAPMYDFGTNPLILEASNLDVFNGPLRLSRSLFQTNDPSMRLTDWTKVFNVARLGSFDVPLRSDPAERTNIVLSARAVDGVTLLPGQVFSFNDVVGERSPEKGYRDGWMFDNGHLIRGTGGGICLVATGLYNVALKTGLGLVERHPHSGMVHYAAPGCDAAVVYGDEDLRFKNTTTGPLYIRALQGDHKVSVVFYGNTPPPGYRVVLKQTHFALLSPPPAVTKLDDTLPSGQSVIDQRPREGFQVILQRIILQNGRVLRKEVVAADTHVPLAKITRVGPTDLQRVDSFLSDLLSPES